MADFSFKSVLRESRRIAVFSDLSLLLLYVCAVNLPLFWFGALVSGGYEHVAGFGKCNSFIAIIVGQAQCMSFGLLWFVFCVLLFFLWGLSWKRKNAMKPVCTCMFHFHLQSKEPRSHEMSAPVLGATLEVQNTMRLQRSSVTAKTMQHPLHRTEQPLRCKTQSNCAD